MALDFWFVNRFEVRSSNACGVDFKTVSMIISHAFVEDVNSCFFFTKVDPSFFNSQVLFSPICRNCGLPHLKCDYFVVLFVS